MQRIAEVTAIKHPHYGTPRAGLARVIQIFHNVNMVKSHRGLKALAHDFDIDLESLERGQYVAFLNRARNKVKLYATGNIYAYLPLPDPRGMVMAETIEAIFAAFQSTVRLEMNNDLRDSLENPLPAEVPVKRGPGRPRKEEPPAEEEYQEGPRPRGRRIIRRPAVTMTARPAR